MNPSRPLTRPIFAWAMYDFANSAFATSVISVVFSVYFATVLVPPEGVHFLGMVIPGESLWGYLISSVMAVVMVLAPALGALADERAIKRVSLMFWACLGAVGSMSLYFATPGNLFWALFALFFTVLGYEMSLVFYNAFLKDISDEDNSGRISGLGFALGYIGGGLCLMLIMWMINKPETFGLGTADRSLPIRVGMLVVGAWWMIFSLPTFLWVRDRFVPKPDSRLRRASDIYFPSHVFRQLMSTIRDVRKTPELGRFLLAYLIYDDGIQTVLLMASIFGAKALGMSPSQLALCYLMIQFVAFVGALVCGRLADSWGHKNVIACALVIYSLVVSWAVFMNDQREFWMLSVVVGLILGGSQAASRSLYATLVPPGRSGEFFALFSIIGKAAALIGPFVFSVVSQFWGLRAGVGSLLAFFIIGGIILIPVQSRPHERPTV